MFSVEEVLSEHEDRKPLSMDETLSHGGLSISISAGGGGRGSFGSLVWIGGGT